MGGVTPFVMKRYLWVSGAEKKNERYLIIESLRGVVFDRCSSKL